MNAGKAPRNKNKSREGPVYQKIKGREAPEDQKWRPGKPGKPKMKGLEGPAPKTKNERRESPEDPIYYYFWGGNGRCRLRAWSAGGRGAGIAVRFRGRVSRRGSGPSNQKCRAGKAARNKNDGREGPED